MMLGFAVGALAGVLITVVAVVIVMRSRMLQVVRSPLGFDDTVAALERGIERAEGWTSPGTRSLNGMMKKHGVEFGPRVTLVEMCKAPYARDVLTDDRRMATLMPCALAVYEDDAGGVRVSKMNVGLLGRVFGGTVGRVMGGLVAREESSILAALETASTPARGAHPTT